MTLHFAVIDSENLVINTVVADDVIIASEHYPDNICLQIEDLLISPGFTYNPEDETFSPPNPIITHDDGTIEEITNWDRPKLK